MPDPSPTTSSSGSARQPYLLDSGNDLGAEQLECLGLLLDRHSIDALTATGVGPGHQWLEIGAGNGNIARWMAERAHPGGRVRAVDIETAQLSSEPGLEVLRHDINEGVPGGPYDVIHARLVLMHLARRRELVRELVDALAPGGWLVLGEFLGPPIEPIEAPSQADRMLFSRVLAATINQVGRPAGIAYAWAHEVDGALVQAGLQNVHTERHQETATGGGTGCRLYRNYIRQAARLLTEVGTSAEDLAHFDTLMLDPRFRAWFFEFTSVRAQKPA